MQGPMSLTSSVGMEKVKHSEKNILKLTSLVDSLTRTSNRGIVNKYTAVFQQNIIPSDEVMNLTFDDF